MQAAYIRQVMCDDRDDRMNGDAGPFDGLFDDRRLGYSGADNKSNAILLAFRVIAISNACPDNAIFE
jgi:hypothetical protein